MTRPPRNPRRAYGSHGNEIRSGTFWRGNKGRPGYFASSGKPLGAAAIARIVDASA